MERNNKMTPLSQQLRRNMTKEENLLWHNFLKSYPLRFRRQYVIGNYIVDFYCHKGKIAVELDGSQHYEPQGQKRDAARTAYLQSQGVRVLRFSNLEVLQQFQSVCEVIDTEAQNRFSRGEAVERSETEEERRD